MEVGHLIHFSSQKYPFVVVETEPCLDLDCSCSLMGLTLREVDLSSPPRDRLKFTLRVCLKTWTEDYPPPPRSLEVETLAREFMVRFPVERRQELSEEFQRRRAQQRRRDAGRCTTSDRNRPEIQRFASWVFDTPRHRSASNNHGR